jgi:DNA mismatch repair ATPase MutS
MPYHAIETYVTKLVAAGYRIAVAEQVVETRDRLASRHPDAGKIGPIEIFP